MYSQFLYAMLFFLYHDIPVPKIPFIPLEVGRSTSAQQFRLSFWSTRRCRGLLQNQAWRYNREWTGTLVAEPIQRDSDEALSAKRINLACEFIYLAFAPPLMVKVPSPAPARAQMGTASPC